MPPATPAAGLFAGHAICPVDAEHEKSRKDYLHTSDGPCCALGGNLRFRCNGCTRSEFATRNAWDAAIAIHSGLLDVVKLHFFLSKLHDHLPATGLVRRVEERRLVIKSSHRGYVHASDEPCCTYGEDRRFRCDRWAKEEAATRNAWEAAMAINSGHLDFEKLCFFWSKLNDRLPPKVSFRTVQERRPSIAAVPVGIVAEEYYQSSQACSSEEEKVCSP
ncbi:hypothetical protein C8T65DRAFT_700737 [Cerioporus squamosus]|nr:hypothetical protein C8T65DRAFT_700737 [Cerioporus squamosus]